MANESTIVAGFDASSDQVVFSYDAGSGVRALCAFDTRRNDFASVDGDIGIVISATGVVESIALSTATPPAAPAAPTIVSTTSVTNTSAVFTWTVGDTGAQHEIGTRVQGAPSYDVQPLTDATVTTYTRTGIVAGTAYEWRIRALKSGVYSAYVGPIAASRFTTTGAPSTSGSAPTGLSATPTIPNKTKITLAWTNASPSLPILVYRSTDGVAFTQVATVTAGVTTTTNEPGAFGTFYYEVAHQNADGTTSALSDYASVTTTPP